MKKGLKSMKNGKKRSEMHCCPVKLKFRNFEKFSGFQHQKS